MRHTCDTAEDGSERSENTCAACHDDQARWQRKHPPDFSWLYEDRKLIQPKKKDATSSELGR